MGISNGVKNGHGLTNGHIGNNHKRKLEETLAWKRVSNKGFLALSFGLPLLLQVVCGTPWWCYPAFFLLSILPMFFIFMVVFNRFCLGDSKTCRMDDFIVFKDPLLESRYRNKKIPMQVLYENYADGKIDFKMDVLEALENRHDYVNFALTFWHVKFFLCNFLPEVIWHSRAQDREQVCDHYDRGNDFYNAFLGPMMIYTSGIVHSKGETLEELQENKLELVCNKISLQPGDRHLDIGCGWGTLVNYATEYFKSDSIGVSLAKNQIDWGRGVAKEKSQEDRARFLCMDYRDIPRGKYDKITCLEMAEHVGVRLFPSFLSQVRDMLEDDGVFFLQIAGLRRAWQWEDFIWGLFMAKYIFPGADASCPLGWVVNQLEDAGFEVQSVQTIGVHYSHTIHRWYKNWLRPETQAEMKERYGERLYRIWEIFLSWSTIIARQGNSTCFQIVCHKNLNRYDRTKFFKTQYF